MKRWRLSFLVFAVICVLCLLQAGWYYPQLPASVASHFGPTGHPDAWWGKAPFFGCSVAVIVGLAALFAFQMPRLPLPLMRLPHAAFWLSTERRGCTFDLLVASSLWFASATMLLVFDLFHQVFQVQMGIVQTLPHPILSLGIYISFVTILTTGLLVTFLRKKV